MVYLSVIAVNDPKVNELMVINKKNLQSFSFSFKGDFLYNFQNDLKVISLDFISNVVTIGNTNLTYTYDLDVFKNYEGVDYNNLGGISFHPLVHHCHQRYDHK